MYNNPWINVAAFIFYMWGIYWEGIALWRAVQLKQRNWFIVILAVNAIGLTILGIPALIYLFWFAKKRLTFAEIKTWKKYFVSKTPVKK